MTQEQWTAVDDYINELFAPSDPVLDAALQATSEAGMPAINVAPNQGKLLHILARLLNAQRILEVGTLAGYSTIWLARALAPGGRLISLEADPKHAEVAQSNIARAGLAGTVEVRLGPALDTLPTLESEAPFDLVFIDADKQNTPAYYEWALKFTRPGGLIITDNVVRDGAVIDPTSDDPSVKGVRQFNTILAAEPRVLATALQTVGSKGYDGISIALVTGEQPT